jgi:hypothetical protein
MKLLLNAGQEIALADLLADLPGLSRTIPITIKIHKIEGDLLLTGDDFLGETIDSEIAGYTQIEDIMVDMFLFTSENGCEAEYSVWQSGKEIID